MMGRHNRHTVKQTRVTQRSKVARYLHEAEQRVVYRTANPRPDERGETDWVTLVVSALIISTLVSMLLFAWFTPKADARAVRIEPAQTDRCERNPVTYLEHVQRRWHYAELCDGSTWMVTLCRYEDSNNCLWAAWRQGNGEGRSFVMLRGVKHWVLEAALP